MYVSWFTLHRNAFQVENKRYFFKNFSYSYRVRAVIQATLPLWFTFFTKYQKRFCSSSYNTNLFSRQTPLCFRTFSSILSCSIFWFIRLPFGASSISSSLTILRFHLVRRMTSNVSIRGIGTSVSVRNPWNTRLRTLTAWRPLTSSIDVPMWRSIVFAKLGTVCYLSVGWPPLGVSIHQSLPSPPHGVQRSRGIFLRGSANVFLSACKAFIKVHKWHSLVADSLVKHFTGIFLGGPYSRVLYRITARATTDRRAPIAFPERWALCGFSRWRAAAAFCGGTPLHRVSGRSRPRICGWGISTNWSPRRRSLQRSSQKIGILGTKVSRW